MNVISREACLIFFIQAFVFILCKKTGNFLEFLSTHISTFHKIKMKT